jgi:hypothetical protein
MTPHPRQSPHGLSASVSVQSLISLTAGTNYLPKGLGTYSYKCLAHTVIFLCLLQCTSFSGLPDSCSHFSNFVHTLSSAWN